MTEEANENAVPKGGDDQSFKAKVKEVTGWATGDRSVEAEGRAESEAETPEEVEEQIRIEHGDKGVTNS